MLLCSLGHKSKGVEKSLPLDHSKEESESSDIMICFTAFSKVHKAIEALTSFI